MNLGIITLGEKRGEICVNGKLVINEKYWDYFKASFDDAFQEESHCEEKDGEDK